MGTPEFAVPSLEILVKNNFNVVAVVTAPDKPKGRGQKVATTPIKDFAVTHNIPVLQPERLKSPEFLASLKSFDADLQIIVAFRMLPEVVWQLPKLGTFNLHASLLPQYRGAAPINWAIINGEKETGITTFFLKHEIDTGNVIFSEKEPIADTDDAGTLYERLKIKGAKLVLKTVQAIEAGTVKTTPQPDFIEIKHAPKIFRENCEINWQKSNTNVYNFIRGLAPYPAASTTIKGKFFKILKASIIEHDNFHLLPGEIETDSKNYLYIKCGTGMLSVLELQPEAKKKMLIQEFLRGNKI